jgi:glyceraldehyde 3-phosphate dehydrogenase (phosphorylating)
MIECVILTAPSKSEGVIAIVHVTNQEDEETLKLFSCASCTTKCVGTSNRIPGRGISIKKAMMTTVHVYASTQALVDSQIEKLWKAAPERQSGCRQFCFQN